VSGWKTTLSKVFGIRQSSNVVRTEESVEELINRSSELLFNVAKIANGFIVLIELYDKHDDSHRTAHYVKDISDVPEVIASLTAQYKLKL
jgi:adenylyl- and sulfurtransferase ThiI